MGQIVDYQHPERLGDFVRVYRRHAVVLSERARGRGGSKRAQTGADLRYHVAEENKVLERTQQDGEPFAYLFWNIYKDQRGFDVLGGPVQYWLLNDRGVWTHRTDSTMTVTELSEPSVNEPFQTRIVGLVFSLGDITHILRTDPVYMTAPRKQKGGGK